jgi:Putative Ig domain
MKRSRLIAAGIVTAALAVGSAGAAYAVSSSASVRLPNACVKYGVPNSILGNYMLWNWNNSTSCPGGTYAVYFPQSVVTISGAPTATVTETATGTATATTTVTAIPTTSSTPATTVTVNNPGAQANITGTAIAGLAVVAFDSDPTQVLSYSATGLPPGLTVPNHAIGLITGTPTTVGTYSVTVTATDTNGAHGSVTFTWTITAHD